MSIPVKLNVDLETARGTYRVTRDLRSLSFRSVVPGGFASCQIELDRPLDIDPVDIAYYGTLTVSDGRHGGVVFQGRTEDPSRGVGSDGRIWHVAAVGPSAHTDDQTVPLIYADISEERWRIHGSSGASQRIEQTEDANGAPVWRVLVPEGTASGIGTEGRIRYDAIAEAGQSLGRVRVGWDAGFTSANWDVELRTSPVGAASTLRDSASVSTSGGTLLDGTLASTGDEIASVRLHRHTGSSTIGDSNTWAIFGAIVVRAALVDAEGGAITGTYADNTILAHEVVADLLGRLLDQYDGATASIATTTTAIDQLAYPDGVTPRKVLQDLQLFEPDHYWAAWEKTVNDKFRFEYTEWPTEVAYEATADDGYSSSGSAVDLYNRVTVRWRDESGRIRTTTRTATVDVLDDAGLTRTGFVDLGDEAASTNDAITAGDNFLSEHGTPPNAGQLTIARPILDHSIGRLVAPWEIKPGKLIRVRDIQPRVDALNPGGRDGVTVFRVVGVTYNSDNASAVLELDSKPLTIAQALAKVPQLAGPFRQRRR